ncbi:MAG TPA: GDSL-type esterase/lipase family protein [Candidatus Hydrogenedentes bacterium]|nr:GDSL-type esterase/lipase family protein [Candidatus Hydrogenedentota bacterium]
MLSFSLILCASLSAPTLENALPMHATGPWTVEIGPGKISTNTRTTTISKPVSFTISPAERVSIKDEEIPSLPVFNENTGGWIKGAKPLLITTQECTAAGALYPETLRVKPAPGDTPPFVLDKDYRMDPFWGTVGRIEGGAIAANQQVYLDYDYAPNRLDSIVSDEKGNLSLVKGQPGVGSLPPPALNEKQLAVANIWVPGKAEQLTEDLLYPIDFGKSMQMSAASDVAERLLPKTLAKLRSGDPLVYVAWGDSVTNGGGVDGDGFQWYQQLFVNRLKQRFPKANITLKTAAWPGGNSAGYIKAPKGGTYDYQRDVLDPKPDLVTIEFVNDAYLDEAGVKEHYAKILSDLRGVGAEVALITPHLVRPDWMKIDTLKFDEDPRPYVKGLRQFAAENHVALADTAREWCRLWRRGIPYTTLEANSINHPDLRGHTLFAEVLIGMFPKK